jgi:penicillin amidase
MTAVSIEAFRAQMRNWGTPSVNHVVAEASGRIAWMPVGRHPARPNWNGTLPVPGDGRYEWNGFLDPDLLPRVVDPAEGYVATANEMNLGPSWDHGRNTVGSEWSERSRATRLQEVLSATDRHTLATSRALQTDTLSVPARRIGALLAKLERSGSHAGALSLLLGWDHRVERGSAAAALFEIWFGRHLKPALMKRMVPDDAVRRLLVPLENEPILAALEGPDPRLGSAGQRDALMAETLAAAERECVELMGEGCGSWAWGRLHHQLFEHPLASVGPRDVTARFDVGPYPRGGSASTAMFASYRPGDVRVTNGASVRLVMDVGAWDESLCINTPGQSGDPSSPFYRNLAPVWAENGYVPLLYSRERIDSEAVLRLKLRPVGGPA